MKIFRPLLSMITAATVMAVASGLAPSVARADAHEMTDKEAIAGLIYCYAQERCRDPRLVPAAAVRLAEVPEPQCASGHGSAGVLRTRRLGWIREQRLPR